MTAPVVSRPQLESLLAGLLERQSADAPFVIVRGDASVEPEAVVVGGQPVAVFASDSPLAIRAHVSKHRNGPLAIITSCDSTALGADLLARAVSRRIRTVDRWEIIARMFGAKQVTRDLADHDAVADALIELEPLGGYRPVTAKVLDLQTALATLVRIGFEADIDTLVDLIIWAERPAAARALREVRPQVADLVERHLTDLHGPAVRPIFAAIRQGKGDQMTALGLVADVVANDPISPAALRLDLEFGDISLTGPEFAALGRAAVDRVRNAAPSDPIARWLHAGDAAVERVKATADAVRSDVLPSGFEARVGAAAAALVTWLETPADRDGERTAEAALDRLDAHLLAEEERSRVTRMRMAARLVRWLTTGWEPAGTLKGTVIDYLADGSWRDRARETVSRGDRHPEARTVLAEIDAQVLDRVRSHGATTARQLANAAYRHDDLLGVEDLLATVAVRAAEAGPVLVLVLDGMGWPSFLEVAEQLERQGWHPVTHADLPAQPTALATLPTVTEFSRASLLCGSLRSGQQDSETRYFPSLEAFRPFDKKPPLLFHKADLRQGGLDTLSGHVVEAIEDRGRHIVGVVLNNIDERLKDVEAPPAGWDLDALTPLRELLRAARHAGRALVVTADHGHILHRDDTQRPGADGGERWRPTESGPAEEGEIEVKGPRVIVESKSCVMPWDERIHYGPKRNGYHGGLTPVELIVPAVVMMTEEAAGWEPLSIPAPSWWYPTLEIPAVESTASAPVPAKRAAKPSDAPTLFDPVPALVPEAADAPGDSVPAEGDWVDRLLVRNDIASQLQGLRLDSAQVSAVLRLLAGAAGTPVQEERLADSLGMPRPRFSRWLGQLQRVLNVDGYEVLASVNGAVRLDRQLLENQMGTL